TSLRKARAETGQAADTLKKRDTLSAFGHMEEAQAALERLSRALPETTPDPKAGPPDKARTAQADLARELAKEQRQLHDAVAKLAATQAMPAGKAAQQRNLQDAEELIRELRQLAQKSDSPENQAAAMKALEAAEKARDAMQSEASGKPEAGAAADKLLDDA